MKNILKKFNLFLVILGVLLFSFGLKTPANALGACYCVKKDQSLAECKLLQVADCKTDTNYTCEMITGSNPNDACDQKVLEFNNAKKNEAPSNSSGLPSGGIVGKFLPKCVTADKVELECRDVTIFLVLMFNIITYLFSIIGGVALLYFVYGGFVFILSQGNAEKVAQGKGIIVAAVLGIVIAFGGYALVSFVGQIVGLNENFTLK